MSSYQPIASTEFRVVHLLPGQFADPLRCILETRQPKIKTSYEALSYEWGAATAEMSSVHIAHYAPSPASSPPDIIAAAAKPLIPTALSRASVRIWRNIRAFTAQYALTITLASGSGLSYQVWRFINPLPFDSSDWSMWFSSRHLRIILCCLVCGFSILDMSIRAVHMLSEMARTKPWLLLTSSGKMTVQARDSFNIIPVTPNLELALRHLRLEKRQRTLWIDALCINQSDEEKKKVQIQRMDLIYANASAVLIWLGDCHGISAFAAPHSCLALSDGSTCRHDREISEAFDYISAVSGMNRLVPKFIRRRDLDEHLKAARPGLSSIAQRGWWRRLWVIQEAALGTATVHIQCGRHTCDFERFESAQARLLQQRSLGIDFEDKFKGSERFISVQHEFRYSPCYDAKEYRSMLGRLSEGVAKCVTSLVFGKINSDRATSFHERSFPLRLLSVLLKTAGHFECRDDRDRLAAILGIVRGTKKVPSLFANLIEVMSDRNTYMAIQKTVQNVYRLFYGDSWGWIIGSNIAGSIFSTWCRFYDARAKHWTISRPEFVMIDSTEVLEAIEINREAWHDRGAFFRLLAQHIANKTGSLAFLEAASCGENDGLPSWVPIWKRAIDDSVYDFVLAKKDGLPLDTFHFVDEGNTLVLIGLDEGTVRSVRVVDEALLHSEDHMFHLADKLYSLLEELASVLLGLSMRAQLLTGSDDIDVTADLLPATLHAMREILGGREQLLASLGTSVIHYRSGKDGEEVIGLVKAGQVKQQDRIVSVPGCYHQLVLRIATVPGGDQRWKLVGLVHSLKTRILQKDEGWRRYTAIEWKEMLKGRKLNRFAIA